MKLGNLFSLNNYRDIVERDGVERYRIKYPKALKDIAKYLNNMGKRGENKN